MQNYEMSEVYTLIIIYHWVALYVTLQSDTSNIITELQYSFFQGIMVAVYSIVHRHRHTNKGQQSSNFIPHSHRHQTSELATLELHVYRTGTC